MNDFRKLAGQTVIYGLGTIVPRFLHYGVLTTFYTRIFKLGEYGVVTELYSWMVLALVLLTYGMETGFFRFANRKEANPAVFGTALASIGVTSLLFILLSNLFIEPLAGLLNYSDHKYYIRLFILIVAVDAFAAIPFASLRNQNKALKFSLIKITNVLITIGLVFFFYLWAPKLTIKGVKWVGYLYKPEIGVGYVFIANAVSSVVTLLMLIPEILKTRFTFDFKVWRQMIGYSFPLL